MSTGSYHRDAERFFEEYEGIPFEQAHRRFLASVPSTPGMVLDVGAGSGRDAAWFAARGHEVVAVEPARGLRDRATTAHDSPHIQWVDDSLPALDRLRRGGACFDIVWLSAVWMHVPVGDRPRAFRKLANSLRPGGRLFISLRHGPFDDDRRSHGVSAAELLELSRKHGLICIDHGEHQQDLRGRTGVGWETMVFELPDDGSGAFPKLRNIILNDDRASTYKLGLLKALIRVADGSAGGVRTEEDGVAVVPLGLVALYWLRLYMPLIAEGFRQTPGTGGYGFVDDEFRQLDIAPSMLKPGARFTGSSAMRIRRALRRAAHSIVDMPARFITDASGQQIFKASYRRQRSRNELPLEAEALAEFGELRVPADLWRAMRQHAVWLEPVIESEWIRTMRSYDRRLGRHHGYDAYRGALVWGSPERDTREVRGIVTALRDQRTPLRCTWLGTSLRDDYAVDHAIPWIRWPCNDLWNLVPASVGANSRKRDRLPSAELLRSAEERLCQWWTLLQRTDDEVDRRFAAEVRATLPFVEHPSNAQDVFDGLALLRASLRRDQQIPEWDG